MKKSIKLLSMAAATMLLVVACKSKTAEPVDSLNNDSIEMIAPIETSVEDTVVAAVEQAATSTKKNATKAKVEEKNTVTAKTLNVSGKQDVKDATRDMKQGEGNSVEQKELNTKKDARSAFRNR
ncbi:MAG: hypothetical protein SPM02_02490 [Bacteroidales bacterium]|nr:hypothetical protein [Bacteroidales bacterium]